MLILAGHRISSGGQHRPISGVPMRVGEKSGAELALTIP